MRLQPLVQGTAHSQERQRRAALPSMATSLAFQYVRTGISGAGQVVLHVLHGGNAAEHEAHFRHVPQAGLSGERHTDNAYAQQDDAETFTAGDFLVEGQEAHGKRPENAEHAP